MTSSRILRWLSVGGRARRKRRDFLLSQRHFAAALRRERLRSDRTLERFTLVTLTFLHFRRMSSVLRASGGEGQEPFQMGSDFCRFRVRG